MRRQKTGSVLQLETDTGQTVYARHEPETGQTAPIRHETITGQTAYTSACTASPPPETALPPGQLKRTVLPSLQLKTTSIPGEDSARPAGHTVARQQEGEMRQVDKVLPVQQLPNDFSRQPETDAKAGMTQHPPCKKSRSASQNVRHRTADRTSRQKRRSTSTPRSTSTEGKRRDQKKSAAREDEPYPPSDASMDSSSEEEVVPPKHMMKPPTFDGQCSFETFMVQFSNCGLQQVE